MSRTVEAYRKMGKCLGGVRYVPDSEMAKLEEENAKQAAMMEKLYTALHDMAPHYDSLVSQHGGPFKTAYRLIYENAIKVEDEYESMTDTKKERR